MKSIPKKVCKKRMLSRKKNSQDFPFSPKKFFLLLLTLKNGWNYSLKGLMIVRLEEVFTGFWGHGGIKVEIVDISWIIFTYYNVLKNLLLQKLIFLGLFNLVNKAFYFILNSNFEYIFYHGPIIWPSILIMYFRNFTCLIFSNRGTSLTG